MSASLWVVWCVQCGRNLCVLGSFRCLSCTAATTREVSR